MSTTLAPSAPPANGFDVDVFGRDCPPLGEADIRRLFGAGALTAERLGRIREWPRVVVSSGGRVVGAATCHRMQDELLVPDLAVQAEGVGVDAHVMSALVDALETACLAGGGRRVVLSPPRALLPLVAARGYQPVTASCAGCWVEKPLA